MSAAKDDGDDGLPPPSLSFPERAFSTLPELVSAHSLDVSRPAAPAPLLSLPLLPPSWLPLSVLVASLPRGGALALFLAFVVRRRATASKAGRPRHT